MRNISIDLTKGSITTPIFCGYDGEHMETVLSIILPTDMIASNYVYKILYRTSVGGQVEDNDFHDLKNGNILMCNLRYNVMKAGILRMQIIAYKQDENDSSALELIAKTQMIPLLVKESITGEADKAVINVDNGETYWTEAMAQMRDVSEQISTAKNTFDSLNSANSAALSNITTLQIKNEKANDNISTLQNILNAADADRRMSLIKEYLDADANAESDFSYSVNDDDDTITITGYIGTSDNVFIPHIIENRIVTTIGANSFQRTDIISVSIPNTITEIGYMAFWECSQLSRITFDSESLLRSISTSAFGHCSQLSSIELPESLAEIGNTVFVECTNLSSVIARNTSNISSWGENIFHHCSSNLTLYEWKGNILKTEAQAKGYTIRKYIYSESLTDLFYALETCSTVEQIVSEISDYLNMTD